MHSGIYLEKCFYEWTFLGENIIILLMPQKINVSAVGTLYKGGRLMASVKSLPLYCVFVVVVWSAVEGIPSQPARGTVKTIHVLLDQSTYIRVAVSLSSYLVHGVLVF